MSLFPCASKIVCECADDQIARNFSAEAPDPFTRFSLVFYAGRPPLNSPPEDYVTPVGVGGCFAATQQDADDCALRDVQERVWGPWQPPGNGIFGNAAQTCLIPCANGAPDFEYTVPAGTFLAHSQAEANALAASYCRNRGLRLQECLLPPSVLTGEASDATATSVTLNGTVNPNGVPTIFYFEYGLTSAYGHVTPIAAAGDGIVPVAFAVPVTGLSPGTYHFRIVATSSSGTTHGLDKNFQLIAVCASPGFWDLGYGANSSWGIAAAGGKTVNVDASGNINRFNGSTLENTLNFFKLASDSGLGATQSGFIVTINGGFFTAADVGRVLHWVTQAVRYFITGFTSPTEVTVDTLNTIGTDRDSSVSGVTATQALLVVTASGPFFSAGDVGKNLRWHGTGDTYLITAFISATQVQVNTSNAEVAQAVSVEQFFDLDVEAYSIGGVIGTAKINQTGDMAATEVKGGNNLIRLDVTMPGLPVIVAASSVGRLNAASNIMGTNGTYYYKDGTSLATGITLAIFSGSASQRDRSRFIAQATDKYLESLRNALLGQTLRVWENGVLTSVSPSPLPPIPVAGAPQNIQGRSLSAGGSCIVTAIGSSGGSNYPFWYITDMAGYSQQLVAPLTGVGAVNAMYQINDSKQAVGSVQLAVGLGPVIVAADGTVTAIPLFGANTTGEANSINASGIAVGYQTAAGVNTAFLYKNGVVYNLNDYLPAAFLALGWYLSVASVITDDGYILGMGKLAGLDASFLMCVSALA